MTSSQDRLPRGLPFFFAVHFAADMVFAVPLMVHPGWLLGHLGWEVVDPVAARLVAAALMGIGLQSLLGRRETPEAYRAMLNLKIIWSLSACVGLVWSLAQGAPWGAWLVLAIFVPFSAVWIGYRLALGRRLQEAAPGAQ